MNTDQEILRVVGERIRNARNKKGLSQEQLAHIAGLHRTYIGSVERGERNLTTLNIITLATVLDVPPGTFLNNLQRNIT